MENFGNDYKTCHYKIGDIGVFHNQHLASVPNNFLWGCKFMDGVSTTSELNYNFFMN